MIIPDDGKKKVLIGTRMSSTKEKRSQLDEDAREAQEEVFSKASKGLDVEAQDEDWSVSFPVFHIKFIFRNLAF